MVPQLGAPHVHGLGFRYRLHAKDLPGCPDLEFRSHRKVVFVHGCFWHRHEGCSRNRIPKSPERRGFWRDKLDGNAQRAQMNQAALRGMGWHVLVIWEPRVNTSGLPPPRVLEISIAWQDSGTRCARRIFILFRSETHNVLPIRYRI